MASSSSSSRKNESTRSQNSSTGTALLHLFICLPLCLSVGLRLAPCVCVCVCVRLSAAVSAVGRADKATHRACRTFRRPMHTQSIRSRLAGARCTSMGWAGHFRFSPTPDVGQRRLPVNRSTCRHAVPLQDMASQLLGSMWLPSLAVM